MVEEIGGGVAITEEILPSQREFFPTHLEHLRKNAVEIRESWLTTGGGGTVFYTVPAKHILYLNSAMLWGVRIGAGSGNFTHSLRLYTATGNSYTTLLHLTTPTQYSTATITIPYFMPLKVEENMRFEVRDNGANSQSLATITGFLVKKPVV